MIIKIFTCIKELSKSHNAQNTSNMWKTTPEIFYLVNPCLGQLLCNCGMIRASSLTIISLKLHEYVNKAVTGLLWQAMTERFREAWGRDCGPTPRPPCGSRPQGLSAPQGPPPVSTRPRSLSALGNREYDLPRGNHKSSLQKACWRFWASTVCPFY